MYKYLQVFPEEKSLCVRFLACLSGLCLLALNTFGKREKEGEGCMLDPVDQDWGPVYTCSCCCHVQWTSFLCVVWAGIYQVQDGFRFLETAVAGVIFLDDESPEVCSLYKQSHFPTGHILLKRAIEF